MNPPLGFLLTCRTYGTWLHGDPRGSVDAEHNVYGTPVLPPDQRRAEREAQRRLHPAMLFDSAQRRTAETAIHEACAFHKWELLALAVRTNHVHAVLAYAHLPPESMARRLKARVTRLLRQHGQVTPHQPVWADRHGSRRYLWTEQDIADAVLYVTDYQNEPPE